MKKGNEQKEKLAIKFGQVLRMHREKAKLSQEELASDIGMDRTYISLLERGKRTPTISTVFQLSTKLNIKPSNLVAEVEGIYFTETP